MTQMHNSSNMSILMSHHHTFLYTAPPPPTESYTLSLHDALPISCAIALPFGEHRPYFGRVRAKLVVALGTGLIELRSEEHTSELQSHVNLVCRLLLEKKK